MTINYMITPCRSVTDREGNVIQEGWLELYNTHTGQGCEIPLSVLAKALEPFFGKSK